MLCGTRQQFQRRFEQNLSSVAQSKTSASAWPFSAMKDFDGGTGRGARAELETCRKFARAEAKLNGPPGPIYYVRDSGGRRGSHLVQGFPIEVAVSDPVGAICRIRPRPDDNFAECIQRLLAQYSNEREIFQSTCPVQNYLRPTLAIFLAACCCGISFGHSNSSLIQAKNFLEERRYPGRILAAPPRACFAKYMECARRAKRDATFGSAGGTESTKSAVAAALCRRIP